MIFVDTGFFFAFFSEDDANHGRVVEVFEEFEGRNLFEILVTTDHVVFETITLTRHRISHERAVFVGERLYAEKKARIYRASFARRRPPRRGTGLEHGRLGPVVSRLKPPTRRVFSASVSQMAHSLGVVSTTQCES